MPEGPQVARYARLQSEILVGKRIHADSPNGRAAAAAAFVDGKTLRGIEAVGKHLLYDFGSERYLHVHLGRFGNFDDGPLPLPEPRGILRFRMYTAKHWFELRGAIAIEMYDAAMRARLEARIGPNPLEPSADPKRAFVKMQKSRTPIGLLLMDQSIVAGIGNIYRSEVLFLNHVHPRTPGNALDLATWRAMWKDWPGSWFTGPTSAESSRRIRRIATSPRAQRAASIDFTCIAAPACRVVGAGRSSKRALWARQRLLVSTGSNRARSRRRRAATRPAKAAMTISAARASRRGRCERLRRQRCTGRPPSSSRRTGSLGIACQRRNHCGRLQGNPSRTGSLLLLETWRGLTALRPCSSFYQARRRLAHRTREWDGGW